MNTLRNSVRLIGRLGENPNVKRLESGKIVANFNLATNETYLDPKGQKVTETTWHRLVAWGKQAEAAEKYLKKGSEVALEGRLTNRQYEDKNGEKHFITEILVNSLLMLDKPASALNLDN